MRALPAGCGVAHGTGIARFACAGRTQCWHEHLLVLQADPPSGDGGYNVQGQAVRAMLALPRIMLERTGTARNACIACEMARREWDRQCALQLRWRAQREDEQLLALHADPPSGDGGYNVRGQAVRAMLALSRIMLDGTGSARFAYAGERNARTSSCWHFMRSTVWRRWLHRAGTGIARNACGPIHRLATVATLLADDGGGHAGLVHVTPPARVGLRCNVHGLSIATIGRLTIKGRCRRPHQVPQTIHRRTQ